MALTYTLDLPTVGSGNAYDAETKIISALTDLSDNVATQIDGFIAMTKGKSIACVGAITPNAQIFHGTGTGALVTINVPYTGFYGNIVIIPDATFTWTTTGNIALAGTAVVNKALTLTYDGTKWNPSY